MFLITSENITVKISLNEYCIVPRGSTEGKVFFSFLNLWNDQLARVAPSAAASLSPKLSIFTLLIPENIVTLDLVVTQKNF